MRLINTKQGKVVVMNFVDAEHCGMDYSDLKSETGMIGIDIEKEKPIALLIQFDGGFIINQDTEKEVIEKMKKATKRFEKLGEEIRKGT